MNSRRNYIRVLKTENLKDIEANSTHTKTEIVS